MALETRIRADDTRHSSFGVRLDHVLIVIRQCEPFAFLGPNSFKTWPTPNPWNGFEAAATLCTVWTLFVFDILLFLVLA